jgi:isocitrate lyase
MAVERLVIARTDSEAATLITGNVDTRDHAFIFCTTNLNDRPLVEVMSEAAQRSATVMLYRPSRTTGSCRPD